MITASQAVIVFSSQLYPAKLCETCNKGVPSCKPSAPSAIVAEIVGWCAGSYLTQAPVTECCGSILNHKTADISHTRGIGKSAARHDAESSNQQCSPGQAAT